MSRERCMGRRVSARLDWAGEKSDFFSILLTIFGEADQIQMVVVVGENRFRLVAEAHEQMDLG